MATSTYLSNPVVTVNSVDLTNQCTSATVTHRFDQLESTAFGDTGHKFTGGLQTVDVSITFFLSYGSAEVEAILASCVGTGTTTLVISPSGTTESATNPEYTITNCMLANFTPINSTVGELATVEATFTGGTWARDITAP